MFFCFSKSHEVWLGLFIHGLHFDGLLTDSPSSGSLRKDLTLFCVPVLIPVVGLESRLFPLSCLLC